MTKSTIRPASPSEDAQLSRILCNAFLPVWNHNWFQYIREPLVPVPVKASGADLDSNEISTLQRARVGLYLSLIKSTRLLGGEVLVNVVHDSGSVSDSKGDGHGHGHGHGDTREVEYGAVLLWLPPHARATASQLGIMYRSGFLRSMWAYGLVGVYRVIFVFEANIAHMFRVAGVREEEHDFVQMLASNPVYAGRGLASQLLRWRVERCTGDVVMDTTTGQARRAYEQMGFRVLNTVEVQTGCDELGIQLRKGQERDHGVKHVQMVMMLRKGDYIPKT